MSPLLKKLSTYIKKEHYSNFCTFEIASLVNVPGHYLRKYGIHLTCLKCHMDADKLMGEKEIHAKKIFCLYLLLILSNVQSSLSSNVAPFLPKS